MLEIISSFLSSAFLTISVYIFGLLTLKDKDYKKSHLYNFAVLLVSVILHTIIFLWVDGISKTILLCLLFMMTFKLAFNTNYGKSLIASIIYTVLLIIPDLITLGTAIYVFNISKELCYSSISGGIISNISVSVIAILLTYVFKKPLRKIVNYSIPTDKKIILVSFLTLISVAIFFYHLINTFRINNDILGYVIVLITLIVILFSLFKQKMDNDIVLKKYDDLLSIMTKYESDIEEQRISAHEVKNELMTIKCKINDKEDEKTIIKYIDSILGDKVSSSMSKYSKFKYLPSNGLKGFFYYKFMEAENRGVNVSVNISKRIEKSFLGRLDTKDFKNLVRIIGVYLDNAIDASSSSKEQKLGIEIYLINGDAEITISNTFENNINIDKIGKERFSTKGRKRGHGLLLVKHILNENRIFETSNSITGNIYIQKLKVKNINKKAQS